MATIEPFKLETIHIKPMTTKLYPHKITKTQIVIPKELALNRQASIIITHLTRRMLILSSIKIKANATSTTKHMPITITMITNLQAAISLQNLRKTII
jgi:hypothetical protein